MLCAPWERGRPGCLAWLLDAERQQAQACKFRNLRVGYSYSLGIFFSYLLKIQFE
jgi:hypothetical protein